MRQNKTRLMLRVIILIVLSNVVYADGWTNQPSHSTLYTDTITSKTDASSVNVADAQGLFVTGNIVSLGSVGVGTSSQSALLHVSRSSGSSVVAKFEYDTSSNNLLELRNTGASKSWHFSITPKFMISETGVADRFVIDTTGNVGIGTVNPTSRLHVSGTIGADMTGNQAVSLVNGASFIQLFPINDNWGAGTPLIDMTNGASGKRFITAVLTDGIYFGDVNSGADFVFWNHFGGERMRIKANGNVGIGTTSPANALDVGGTSSGAVRIDGRGAFFLAAEAACLASGSGDRFLVWSAGTAQTCSQACATISCGSVASCVQGWTVWSGTTHYRYGPECSSTDPSGGQGISGKLCCCTNTGCAQPMYR